MKRHIRILIVDDDEALRVALREVLQDREEGFEVTLAGSGREAIGEVDVNPPDVILTDIAMPDMEGIELLRRLRERPSGAPAVIVMSGNPVGARFLQSTRLLGAVGTLAKPFTAEALIEQIRNAVGAPGDSTG